MIAKALKQANNSQYRQRIGAVIVKGNRVISTGHNQLRGHGSIKSSHWDNSLHAEIHAVINAIKRVGIEGIKGSTIFVARIKRDGSQGLALPCKDCFRVLHEFKIKRIVFTTETGISEIKI